MALANAHGHSNFWLAWKLKQHRAAEQHLIINSSCVRELEKDPLAWGSLG